MWNLNIHPVELITIQYSYLYTIVGLLLFLYFIDYKKKFSIDIKKRLEGDLWTSWLIIGYVVVSGNTNIFLDYPIMFYTFVLLSVYYTYIVIVSFSKNFLKLIVLIIAIPITYFLSSIEFAPYHFLIFLVIMLIFYSSKKYFLKSTQT